MAFRIVKDSQPLRELGGCHNTLLCERIIGAHAYDDGRAREWIDLPFANQRLEGSRSHNLGHLPGHSQNDRDTGPEEGHGEGCPGRPASLTDGNNDRCLYAGSSGERAVHHPFHQ